MRWLFGNFPTADFHKIWPQNMNLCLLKMYQKGYSKIFTLGVICPKNLKIELDQTRVHPRDTLKRYCSLHKSKGQGVSEVWSTLLYHIRFWNYRTSKFTNFRIFTYFPHTQCQKSTFLWQAYIPGVTSQKGSSYSRRSKGLPFASEVFLQLLVRELETQNCPHIHLW